MAMEEVRAESSSSRKRPLDDDLEIQNAKKINCTPGIEDVFHFKILIPGAAAGSIIGKGGETIADLQKSSSARVKMSKANDFYPGTSERVCLISGTFDGIRSVLDFISSKIQEPPDIHGISNAESDSQQKLNDRDKQMKILVPNSTAGMIIGKGGHYIKKLKEMSGSHIQISQKDKDQSLQERCITVTGSYECNRKACNLILAKVEEDPYSGSCPNISYADTGRPAANFSPTGSPFAQPLGNMQWPGISENIVLPGVKLTIDFQPPNFPNKELLTNIIDSFEICLAKACYPENVRAEVYSAIATLEKYRMLGVHYGGSFLRTEDKFPPLRRQDSCCSSFLQGHDETTLEVAVHIPERLVGAVLGEGGRSLATIQEMSGAVVQISKKGVFVPGTRNRLATVKGNSVAVVLAYSLIQERLTSEKVKRSRHITKPPAQ